MGVCPKVHMINQLIGTVSNYLSTYGKCLAKIFGILNIAFSFIFLAANLLTIAILCQRRCGLSTGVTLYLLAMTTADLLILIFNVVIYYLLSYYFPYSIVEYTPVCCTNEAINYSLIDSSVWLTVAFTVDRSVAICYPKIKAQYCRLRTAQWVTVSVCGLSCLKNIAVYFKFEPVYFVHNQPVGCSLKPTYYTSPGWLFFDWLDTVYCPLVPYFLIIMLNALTIRHILAANRKRRSLFGNRKESSSDPELQSRRKSIILLLTISGSFVLLWMPYVAYFLYSRVTSTDYDPYTYTDPLLIADYTSDIFQLLSSGTNTFIYALAQTRFRQELLSIIKHPFNPIIKFFRS